MLPLFFNFLVEFNHLLSLLFSFLVEVYLHSIYLTVNIRRPSICSQYLNYSLRRKKTRKNIRRRIKNCFYRSILCRIFSAHQKEIVSNGEFRCSKKINMSSEKVLFCNKKVLPYLFFLFFFKVHCESSHPLVELKSYSQG